MKQIIPDVKFLEVCDVGMLINFKRLLFVVCAFVVCVSSLQVLVTLANSRSNLGTLICQGRKINFGIFNENKF